MYVSQISLAQCKEIKIFAKSSLNIQQVSRKSLLKNTKLKEITIRNVVSG